VGFSSIARDISARKAFEQKREALLQLERQARVEAEKANQLKLQFLAMISHELRTPLTSIKGFSTTLLAEDVEWTIAQHREFLEIIDDEADKLSELIEQLLDISRMQSGTFGIKPHPQRLEQLMAHVHPQLQQLASTHPLIFKVAENLPLLQIDQQRIIQVLCNLVENASKYSPEASPIEISVSRQGEFVQVSVSDEGVGIPVEDRERVFEAFQQVERKEKAKGAGLGLAICKGLIEAHGGQIWIHDKTPSGTTVCFTLPISSS